jgi:hypothetical protein
MSSPGRTPSRLLAAVREAVRRVRAALAPRWRPAPALVGRRAR